MVLALEKENLTVKRVPLLGLEHNLRRESSRAYPQLMLAMIISGRIHVH
jgi:hypothetical protein